MVTQQGSLGLDACVIQNCQGPALDASQKATAEVQGCTLDGNVGRLCASCIHEKTSPLVSQKLCLLAWLGCRPVYTLRSSL